MVSAPGRTSPKRTRWATAARDSTPGCGPRPDGRGGSAVEGAQQLLAGAGAVVVGRRMFDLGEEPWGDPPPFHDNPVFVVTHRTHAPIVKQGGTTYTFVTEGLEAALVR